MSRWWNGAASRRLRRRRCGRPPLHRDGCHPWVGTERTADRVRARTQKLVLGPGFEHSVVNMFLFPTGLMLGGEFTIADYLVWNEIPTVRSPSLAAR